MLQLYHLKTLSPKALQQTSYITLLRKWVIQFYLLPQWFISKRHHYQVKASSGWHGALWFPSVWQSIGLKRICLCKESAISKDAYLLFIIIQKTISNIACWVTNISFFIKSKETTKSSYCAQKHGNQSNFWSSVSWLCNPWINSLVFILKKKKLISS